MNNNEMKDLNDEELEIVSGGAFRHDEEGFGWHWGDDWSEGGYWDGIGSTKEA